MTRVATWLSGTFLSGIFLVVAVAMTASPSTSQPAVAAAAAALAPAAQTAAHKVPTHPDAHPSQMVHSAPHPVLSVQLTAYTAAPGDTLSSIAARVYGSADLWPALWYTNRHAVKNPDQLAAGTTLALSAWHPDKTWIYQDALAAISPPAAPKHPAVGQVPAPSAPAGSIQPSSSFQACVIQAESGGNPDAQNPTSTASGLYGFLDTTWTAITGMPGPARAYSAAVQTAAFWKLYGEQGPAPWAAYDGC